MTFDIVSILQFDGYFDIVRQISPPPKKKATRFNYFPNKAYERIKNCDTLLFNYTQGQMVKRIKYTLNAF